ncbi:serine hydrolase FSH [Penicillium angulare]|uniref:Serine hydrolase FSH n=1 Tax=Penicillium angulare TaxID=116970 RepID=A0A9W9ESY8_9EURO|nr:serine hydrolase FSH [Penicillium angulare]
MSQDTKPTILCLHGHGSSAEIFQTQSQKVTQALSPHFRFLFLDSPITTSQPGVGVRPHYAHIKPYRRWNQDEKVIGLFGVTEEDVRQERQLVRDTLKDVLERERRDGANAGVVGLMAFSQGTRIATAICQDTELGKDIKFAIIICGVSPPLSLSTPEMLLPPPLNIASVHVQGSTDPWLTNGTKLSKHYFDQSLAKTVKFTGGHEVPVKTFDVENICEVIAEYKGST